MRFSPRAVAAVAALACTASTLASAAAGAEEPARAQAIAGTIVFLDGGNVWLMTGDGRGRYQVTKDGSAESPYYSPTMSDEGVIATGKGTEIVRMRQNGEVLNRMDPPPMINSVGAPVDGPPVQVAISPDGTKIAYTMTSFGCPIGTTCMARAVTGVTSATSLTGPAMTSYLTEPSWVSDTRLMAHGGYRSHVNLQDAGAPVHWFDDDDVFAESTDLGDASLSRDGTRLVAIHGYGDSTEMIWYAVSGDPRVSDPATLPTPQSQCKGGPGDTATDRMLHDPSWAPDGSSFAIGAREGIWLVQPAAACEATVTTLLGSGSQPSWSAAPLAPSPGTNPGGPGGPGGPGTPGVPGAVFQVAERPAIDGRARVGKRLRATAGTWTPAPTEVAYSWLRNGRPIKRATKAAYRVTRKDRGKRLVVRVTVKRAGLDTATARSRAVKVRR